MKVAMGLVVMVWFAIAGVTQAQVPGLISYQDDHSLSNMTTDLVSEVFENAEVHLRAWFSDGTTFEQLDWSTMPEIPAMLGYAENGTFSTPPVASGFNAIALGDQAVASALSATVGGGIANQATAMRSSVGGGSFNKVLNTP